MPNIMDIQSLTRCCRCLTAMNSSFQTFAASPVVLQNRSFHQKRKSHYEVLGVPRTATKQDIKRAFIRKSKQVHPDKNLNNPDTHDQFVEISEAYNVLSNARTRRQYEDAEITFRKLRKHRAPRSVYYADLHHYKTNHYHAKPVKEKIEYSTHEKTLFACIGALLVASIIQLKDFGKRSSAADLKAQRLETRKTRQIQALRKFMDD